MKEFEEVSADQILKVLEEMDTCERIKLLKTLSVKKSRRRSPLKEELAKLNYVAIWGENDDEKGAV